MTGLSASQDAGKLDDYWFKTFNNVIKGFKAYPDFMHYVIYNIIISMMNDGTI